jgi:hypothetical protein
LGEIDFGLLVEIDDGRFVRVAPAKPRQRFNYATERNRKLVPAKWIRFARTNGPSSPAIRSIPSSGFSRCGFARV